MNNLLPSTISEADFETISRHLDAVAALLEPHFSNLTNHEKAGMRTMSTNREGYVRLVAGIANANIDALPRNIDPQVLSLKLDYHSNLAPGVLKTMRIHEMLSEIVQANGFEIMKLSDTVVASLQTARNHSGALDYALADLDEWNKRFGKRDAEPRNPAGGE